MKSSVGIMMDMKHGQVTCEVKCPLPPHESVMTSRRFLGHRVSLCQRERVFDYNFHERWVGGIMKMPGLMNGIRQDTSADALPSRRSRLGLSSAETDPSARECSQLISIKHGLVTWMSLGL